MNEIYQFYVVEIRRYANGEYEHFVYYRYDENENKAKCKGESKFYEIMSQAALSEYPLHSAILFDAEGKSMMDGCYKHDIPGGGSDE